MNQLAERFKLQPPRSCNPPKLQLVQTNLDHSGIFNVLRNLIHVAVFVFGLHQVCYKFQGQLKLSYYSLKSIDR